MVADLALALGWLGAALAVLLNVPQAWRTCVHGQTAGLPLSRFWLGLLSCLIWLSYGLYGGGAVQIVCNGLVGALCLALVVRCTLAAPVAQRRLNVWLPLTAVTVAGSAALNATYGMSAVGYFGAALGLGTALPQMLVLLRNPDASTDGVSRLSCWLLIACNTSWLFYGLLRGETPVWLPNVPSLVFTAITLFLLARATPDAEPVRVQIPGQRMPSSVAQPPVPQPHARLAA